MTRDEIAAALKRVLAEYAKANGVEAEATEETPLVGEKSILDSAGLVAVVMDLEAELNQKLPRPIALADEKALSRTRSPFRTVGTLADYAAALAGESGGAA